MQWTINDRLYQAEPDIRTSLLDLLREHLGLTGSKKGCDHGQCGACTILINGRRVNSCLTLAVMHQEDAITTIEGLSKPPFVPSAVEEHGVSTSLDTNGGLHPLQAAFIRHDGYQCGYCTPGQICSAVGMLDEVEKGWPSHVTDDLAHPALNDREIAERMSGNICRCAAYPNIVDAIAEVAGLDAEQRDSAREAAL